MEGDEGPALAAAPGGTRPQVAEASGSLQWMDGVGGQYKHNDDFGGLMDGLGEDDGGGKALAPLGDSDVDHLDVSMSSSILVLV